MKLNHLNLTVTDVPAARAFLETFFGMVCAGTRGSNFAALFDDERLVLTLMKGKEVAYPQTFHIGFSQTSEAEVDGLHRRMKEAGYATTTPVHAHGYTFYVQAPGGFTVEVCC